MELDLLHKATAQAKTKWLEKALEKLLPQVWNLSTHTPDAQQKAAAWADQIDQMFTDQKLTTPNQQKNRRTDIANALRVIHPDHPAIAYILLPSSVYTAMNHEQASWLNGRENKFFTSEQANQLVERAIALLKSDAPNEVAAGLAVLVGRRISEILLSQFQPKTAYSLLFSEAVKRRGERALEFEIPTLASAERILRAIAHLKQVWNIEEIRALNLSDNHLKRRINARYSGVPRACRQHFADLVPGREAENDDGERLYTHLFRAVYAEIATYYYKPAWVPDHRFKAEIQGHFKLTKDGQKLPNYSARQNYDDYLIRDRSPGEPGVKLGLTGVEIMEVFRKRGIRVSDESRQMFMTEEPPSRFQVRQGTINALLYRAVDRLLFSKQWAEVATGLLLVTGRTIDALLVASPTSKTGFSILIDGIEVPTLTTANQVISAWQQFRQLSPLPFPQVTRAVLAVGDRTFNDLVPVRGIEQLRALYSCIALHWFCPPEVSEAAFLEAIASPDPMPFETVNPNRGVKLAQRNVDVLECFRSSFGSPKGSDPMSDTPSELPTKAEGKLLGDPTNLTLALADQARTLAWLTTRLEALEQEIGVLRQERDAAIARLHQGSLSAELERLQQDNQRLQEERDLANDKLEAFRNLLMGDRLEQTGSLAKTTVEATAAEATTEAVSDVNSGPEMSSDEVATAGGHGSLDRKLESDVHKSKRKRLSEDQALDAIRRAVQAIMDFNDQSDRPIHEKWYISFPVVQTLLRTYGFPANQSNVSTVFKQMKQELEQHHEQHNLRSRHNRRHPELSKITKLIYLDEN